MSKDISKMTFTEAFEELEEISGELEGGEIDIDDAITKVDRATELYNYCQGKLKNAEKKISDSLKKIEVEPGKTKTQSNDEPF